MIAVGFEPTPLRTSALSWRLRPLGQTTFSLQVLPPIHYLRGAVDRHQFNTQTFWQNVVFRCMFSAQVRV
jgi:hypothetical protein